MSSNKELMQRRSQAVPRGVGQIHPIFADRAENCRVWDVEGREYLDFRGRDCGAQYRAPASEGGCGGGSAVEKLSHTCFRCWPTSRIWSCARL